MKKILIIMFAGLLILGCSKTKPVEEQEITVITSTVEEVAAAEDLPELQKPKMVTEVQAAEISKEVTEEIEKVEEFDMVSSDKKPVVLEPSEEDIDVAIEEDIDAAIDATIDEAVEEKIDMDEEITKEITEVTEPELPVEEKKGAKNMGIFVIIAVIVVAAIGYYATRGKK